MKTQKTVLFWIFNITIPIVLGLVIYLLWTADTYISIAVRELFRKANLPEIPLWEVNNFLSKFVRNYLCDMCWAYSLVFCIAPFVGLTQKRIRISVLISSLFAALLEFLQYFGWINGTFDVPDIFVEIIACMIAGMIIKKFVWRNKK